MKIGLVSCSKAKKGYICSAREMYSESNTFRLSLEYLEKTCDKIFILSAKHGLLDLEDTIQPYDETLVEKPVAERRKWADEVILKLKEKTDLEKDQFIILAGQKYNEFLLEHIKKFQLPLEGLTMFKRVPKLKEMIKDLGNETRLIHQIVNEMPRFTWDEIDNLAFTNGIYIIFEKGESYYDLDRIVRVGTHKADGRLKARLKDHYLRKNKDGSIFRKNIGLALLNKDQDPYLRIWKLNTSKPKIKKEYKEELNLEYKKKIEERVSNYLREKTSFTCFEVSSNEERLRIEEGMIALLNNSKYFKSSDKWLGNYHPDQEIRESNLWNKQGLSGQALDLKELWYIGKGQGVKNISNNSCDLNFPKPGKNSLNKNEKIEEKKVSTKDIEKYIKDIFIESKGSEYVDILSKDIHKAMGLKSRYPMVCGAMYNLQKEISRSDILHKTSSGQSSTLKIRYYL